MQAWHSRSYGQRQGWGGLGAAYGSLLDRNGEQVEPEQEVGEWDANGDRRPEDVLGLDANPQTIVAGAISGRRIR